MTDREKVIKGLEMCIMHYCDECPFDDEKGCFDKLMDKAIALLKEQEAVEPKQESDSVPFPWTSWWYVCGDCGQNIDHHDRFCRHCGRSVKWE